jgi:hypothetical protein
MQRFQQKLITNFYQQAWSIVPKFATASVIHCGQQQLQAPPTTKQERLQQSSNTQKTPRANEIRTGSMLAAAHCGVCTNM